MDRKGEVIKIPKCSSQKNTSQHWLDWVEIFWLKWLEWERGECVGFWWEVVLFYWVSHHTSSLGNTTNHLTGIDLSFPDISRPRDIRKGSQQIRRLTIISSSSLPDRKGGEWVVQTEILNSPEWEVIIKVWTIFDILAGECNKTFI